MSSLAWAWCLGCSSDGRLPLPDGTGLPGSPAQVRAYDLGTGELRWQVETAISSSSVVLANDRVFATELVLPTQEGAVRAIEAGSGRTLWLTKLDPGAINVFEPIIVGSRVVVSTDQTVYGLDAGHGERLWQWGSGDVLSGPAVAQGLVYAGQANSGEVVALDILTGEVRWSRQSVGVIGSIHAASGLLFVLTLEGRLLAFDERSGQPRWESLIEDEAISPPARLGEGMVFVLGRPELQPGLGGVALHAIDMVSGRERWEASRFDFDGNGLVTAKGTVFIAGSDADSPSGVIFALGVETGGERWRITRSTTGPTLLGETVYLVGTEGESASLAAVDGATGREWWSTPVGGVASLRPIVSSEVLVLATHTKSAVLLSTVAAGSGDLLWQRRLPQADIAIPSADATSAYVVTSTFPPEPPPTQDD